jgi:hypothetical protein
VGEIKPLRFLILSEKIIDRFSKNLLRHFKNEVKLNYKKGVFELKAGKEELKIAVFKENPCELYNSISATKLHDGSDIKIHLAQDQLARRETQIFSIIRSKLQLNKKIFARKCEVKKVNTTYARLFLDAHHLMEYASSAFHYGLFLNEELIAIAAFSKGRKMDRLASHLRSFELVRFCCKDGVTVTGGLSKLLKHFVDEKKPGDVMTYVDKQWSEGLGYLKCGFQEIAETKKQEFLINKATCERTYYKGEKFDPKKFYLTQNLGNLKLVYTLDKN